MSRVILSTLVLLVAVIFAGHNGSTGVKETGHIYSFEKAYTVNQ